MKKEKNKRSSYEKEEETRDLPMKEKNKYRDTLPLKEDLICVLQNF